MLFNFYHGYRTHPNIGAHTPKIDAYAKLTSTPWSIKRATLF